MNIRNLSEFPSFNFEQETEIYFQISINFKSNIAFVP